MSDNAKELTDERVRPATITDGETGEVYTLDFNREAVKFAENRRFEVEDARRFPLTKIPEFFFYAFRMHHKALARDKTDAILESIGGLSLPLLERLSQLYNQASLANIIALDEDAAKNGKMTVEL